MNQKLFSTVFWITTAACCAIGLAGFLAAGCKAKGDSTVAAEPGSSGISDSIYVWHDKQRDVTCWIYSSGYKGGISCLPDSQLRSAP